MHDAYRFCFNQSLDDPRQPSIIFLDEYVAAVDSKTWNHIRDRLIAHGVIHSVPPRLDENSHHG